MTDWRLRAASVDQAVETDKILVVLEGLDTAFAPLVGAIPAWADIWTAPEDVQ